ncbi:hypothetical protein [Natrialba taiwanensis]|uniref:Uncharacterized protein n=1 Tax=Natrialba taiwanensis DSM 12281 TaxID=1230458 RepID=L9ZI92_9EURY|nr:hypothetical protein [Natrialba taiwanensis]ELY84878.1 hypothetical protein C484_22063 [Natrialba taiwanensis DSM 12281]
MLEWFGGTANVFNLAIPLFGLLALVTLPKIAETNRSRRYFVPAFCCWAGLRLVTGLREGTLVAVPRFLGASLAAVLLVGFLGLCARGLFEVWKLRDESASSS